MMTSSRGFLAACQSGELSNPAMPDLELGQVQTNSSTFSHTTTRQTTCTGRAPACIEVEPLISGKNYSGATAIRVAPESLATERHKILFRVTETPIPNRDLAVFTRDLHKAVESCCPASGYTTRRGTTNRRGGLRRLIGTPPTYRHPSFGVLTFTHLQTSRMFFSPLACFHRLTTLAELA